MTATHTAPRIEPFVHTGTWEPFPYSTQPADTTPLHPRIRRPRRALRVVLGTLGGLVLVFSAPELYEVAGAACTLGAAPGMTCTDVLYANGTPT